MTMKYTVYKTTNLINGKIYIGTHATDDPNDSYLGSGTYLNRATQKYGTDQFRKEVLAIFDNPEDMFNLERELVNEEYLKTTNTYNLRLGGDGGFDYILSHPNISEWRKRAGKQGGDSPKNPFKSSEFKEKYQYFRSKKHLLEFQPLTNTKESILKKKETFKEINHQQGDKNSNFGTKWIFHPESKCSMKIQEEELNDYLSNGWILGRKLPKILKFSNTLGKIRIYNPNTSVTKFVKPSDLEFYLNSKWVTYKNLNNSNTL